MKKEKIYNLLLFILIFISMLSIIILNPIRDLDELWNYNFARNIANGLIPYKDFNMVVTPLLSIVCGLILKITVDELIVMRILAALLCSTVIYITYKIFSILNIRKEVSIIFTFFIGYLFKDILCIDYNYGSLLIALIIIYKEIQYYKKENEFIFANLKQDLFLGILGGLTLTIKQTTGLFICIVLLGNKLLFVRTKDDFKIYFKSLIYRIIGIIIPVLLVIGYLIINSAFEEFIDYTIKGISGFTNIISYESLVHWNLIGVLSILVPISIIYGLVKSAISKDVQDIYLLTVYGLATFVICFPISDKIHFLIGALPIVILILYEIYNLIKFIKNKVLKRKKYIKVYRFILIFIECTIILFLIYNSLINLNKYFSESDDFCDLKHFSYISIDKRLENQINNVQKYIEKNENIKILDASAVTYMIPLDRYNKDYDMLNNGNLGFNGEERIIQEISNQRNVKYLILRDEITKNWQTPLEIMEYVKENKTKIGQIEIFDIYE